MAKLAIKGHPTRGKEVIKILSMLGGYNTSNWSGDDVDAMYFTNTCYCIDKSTIEHSYARVLSLEEFLEKFPYNVGDKVIYENIKREITKMVWEEQTNTVAYKLDDKLYCNVIKELQPYKEETFGECIEKTIQECLFGKKETMEEINIDRIGFNGDKAKLILPDGYEFKTEGKEVYVVKKQPCKEETNMKENTKLNLSAIDYTNGLVGYEIPEGYEFDTVIDNKVIIKKLKPKYPKTYEECCKVLGSDPSRIIVLSNRNDIIHEENKHCFEMYNLYQLLICRDAYWKIVGDWKPDWEDFSMEKHSISVDKNKIITAYRITGNRVLVFPTAEMRDAFYENFKDLIEQSKELL